MTSLLTKNPSSVSGRNNWQLAWRRLCRRKTAMIGLVGFGVIMLCSFLAPWLAPFIPTELNYNNPLAAPSSSHWFGTDDLGRDIFSRVLWGGRESLRTAFLSLAIALTVGISLGLMSGFFGGWLDNLLQRVNDVMLAFPVILLLLSIVAILGPGLVTVMIALGIAQSPVYSRLVRSTVLNIKALDYVDAGRALGASNLRLMFRTVLPNIIAPILVYATTDLGYAVMTTAGLSYIGLGAQPPSPEWGAMLNYGRDFIYDAWWMSVFPGLPIFLTVLCVNLLGDGLRNALDPKTA